WETISLIIEKPGTLGSRAISALRSFRKIILQLREMAGANVIEDSETEDQQSEIRNPQSEILAPVSDIVKAAILNTGYEHALKSEQTDEADARIENLQELVNAAVDYDEQGIEGLGEFIDHSALVSAGDQYKPQEGVTLM